MARQMLFLLLLGKEVVTMNTIREWGFPVTLLVSWLLVSTYTLSALSGLVPRA
jgi:hypothetical protein